MDNTNAILILATPILYFMLVKPIMRLIFQDQRRPVYFHEPSVLHEQNQMRPESAGNLYLEHGDVGWNAVDAETCEMGATIEVNPDTHEARNSTDETDLSLGHTEASRPSPSSSRDSNITTVHSALRMDILDVNAVLDGVTDSTHESLWETQSEGVLDGARDMMHPLATELMAMPPPETSTAAQVLLVLPRRKRDRFIVFAGHGFRRGLRRTTESLGRLV